MMYKCPICGIVLTEKQYQEEIKNPKNKKNIIL